MRAVRQFKLQALLFLTLIGVWGAAGLVEDDGFTAKHEKGRCAIRDQCGKKSFFGGELPCPDNGLAREPSDDIRKKLVGVCGDKWSEGPVCCEENQVGHSTTVQLQERSRLTVILGRRAEQQPETRRIHHFFLSSMQRELLQPLLYLHLLA